MRWQWMALGLSVWLGLPAHGQTNLNSRLAHEARIDLYATTNVVALDQAEVLQGWGQISRLSWMKPADQRRAYSFGFPLLPYVTNELVFRFTPQESGRVTVALLGPYERVPGDKEALFKSEILWPSVDVAGATLTPESVALLKPPVRSWFRQRYDIGLNVQARTPVTLRLGALAIVPEGVSPTLEVPAVQARIAGGAGFRRGIHVASGLDVLRRAREGALIRADEFARIRAEGFDHVRVQWPFHLHAGPAPDFVLSSNVWLRLDAWVQEAGRHRLGVVIGWQEYEGLAVAPALELPRFLAIWKQIAQRYAGGEGQVGFELLTLTGSRSTASTLVLNGVYREALKVVREQAPTRTCFVSPGLGASVAELVRLQIPLQETNVIVTVSPREPLWFLYQSTLPQLKNWGGLRFPGPSETNLPPEFFQVQDPTTREWLVRYATLPSDRNPSGISPLRAMAAFARDWSRGAGRPVYFADWGCSDQIEPGSRARFYAAWRTVLAEVEAGWAILDWKQQHRYWDEASGQPMVGLREALFPGRSAAVTSEPVTMDGRLESVDSSVPLQQALKQLDNLREEVRHRDQKSQSELEAFKAQAKRMEEHAHQVQVEAAQAQVWMRWLLAALFLSGAVAILLIAFRYRQKSLTPSLAAMPVVPLVGGEVSLGADELKEGTMAHLARLLSDKVVQRLLAERRLSQEAQRSAALEIAEMEQRLERLQTPWQERLKAYEARILELEGELARKGEENRELIRAKIDLTRQRMESARTSTE